jgi:putative phage-type endonuclease
MEPIKLLELTEENRTERLELRKIGIGSSDIAAICGLSKYRSALSVYRDKTSDTIDETENEHIEFGNWMEPHIRNRFPIAFKKKEGKEILVNAYPYILQHPEHPWMLYSPDGEMYHPEYEYGGIEIKTAGERQWKEWADEQLPDDYYLQCQWGMAVTSWQYMYIVALVGKRLLWLHIPRNQTVIDTIVEKGRIFWFDHVIPQIPPAPDGSEDAGQALKLLYPAEDGQAIELHGMLPEYDAYKTLQVEIKAKKKRLNEIGQKIMARMGTAEVAFIGDRKAIWKTQHRQETVIPATSFRKFQIY